MDEAIVSAFLGIPYSGKKSNTSRVSAPMTATTHETAVNALLRIFCSGQKDIRGYKGQNSEETP